MEWNGNGRLQPSIPGMENGDRVHSFGQKHSFLELGSTREILAAATSCKRPELHFMTPLGNTSLGTASYRERKRCASSKVFLFLNFFEFFFALFFRAFIPMSPFPIPLFCQQIETSVHLGPWKSDDNDFFLAGQVARA
jgi:hypothetical protein